MTRAVPWGSTEAGAGSWVNPSQVWILQGPLLDVREAACPQGSCLLTIRSPGVSVLLTLSQEACTRGYPGHSCYLTTSRDQLGMWPADLGWLMLNRARDTLYREHDVNNTSRDDVHGLSHWPPPRPRPECRSLASSGSMEWGPFPDELRSGHPPVACVDDHYTLVSAVVLTHRDGHLQALLWFWVFLKRQEKKKKSQGWQGRCVHLFAFCSSSCPLRARISSSCSSSSPFTSSFLLSPGLENLTAGGQGTTVCVHSCPGRDTH